MSVQIELGFEETERCQHVTDLFWQAFSGKLGFVLDGIFVAEGARGLGVGTALLEAGHEQAQTLGLSRVELDVIDANPKAQALYERMGYVVTKQEDLGPLRHLFGFNTAYRMAKVP